MDDVLDSRKIVKTDGVGGLALPILYSFTASGVALSAEVAVSELP